MKLVFVATAAIAWLCLGVSAHAVTIATVTVGNAGNAADTAAHSGNPAGQGSVGYNYNIGKYEVTAAQYTEFLNAKAKTDTYGLYNTFMANTADLWWGCNIQRSGSSGSYTYSVASDWANRPVNYVSYWDACRFANWLGNGQGNGDTETGAYTLGGYNGADGRTIQRNAGCTWAVTSEDEWYKAAYYDPNKPGGAGYWDYATRSNTAPANRVLATDPGNSANYYINNYSTGSPYYRTNVGEFENSASAYGTFDQDGNVWEYNEAIVYQDSTSAYRGVRGGSASNSYIGSLQASYRLTTPPDLGYVMGFRVSEVPEPSSLLALAGSLMSLIVIGKRRT